MKVWSKPEEWESMGFNDKLKWYANRDNKVKNVFADKYQIKFILDEMNLEGLKYASLITHVRPVDDITNLKLLVPVEELLKKKEFRISDNKIKKLFSQVSTTEEFWELVEKKYDIIPEEDDYTPPKFYVIKLNLSWNTMVFLKNNEIIKMVNGTREFEPKKENLVKWRDYTLKHYKKNTPPKFFIEEFIGFNLKVYEVYCVYGKPIILSIYYETRTRYENNYLIIDERIVHPEDSNLINRVFDLEFLKDQHLVHKTRNYSLNPDKKMCQRICDYAVELAKNFEFMRADFYLHKGNIYFSECTFKPGALKYMKWMDIGKILSKYWTRTPNQ
jgi:hypothetical protein